MSDAVLTPKQVYVGDYVCVTCTNRLYTYAQTPPPCPVCGSDTWRRAADNGQRLTPEGPVVLAEALDASEVPARGTPGRMPTNSDDASVRSIERELEDEASRMQRGLDDLDEHIDDAESKARSNRERAGVAGDESLDAVAGDAADRTTSSDDPTSAVGNPTDPE